MSLNLKRVRKALLRDHNRVRSLHGAGPLKVKHKLESSAQNWAEELAKINKNLQHSHSTYKGNTVGENLFGAFHSAKIPDVIAVGATGTWYNEIDRFEFSRPEDNLRGCGHFTQIVWRATSKVGFGVAASSSGRVYVVAQYYPPGNYIGHVAENVRPSIDRKKADFGDNPPRSVGTETTTSSVEEDIVDGKNIRRTVIMETEHFADGSTSTATKTKTETVS